MDMEIENVKNWLMLYTKGMYSRDTYALFDILHGIQHRNESEFKHSPYGDYVVPNIPLILKLIKTAVIKNNWLTYDELKQLSNG